MEPIQTWRGHEDCVNGVHFHPNQLLFASSSGQRHFSTVHYDDDENDVIDTNATIENDNSTIENSLKIWTYNINP